MYMHITRLRPRDLTVACSVQQFSASSTSMLPGNVGEVIPYYMHAAIHFLCWRGMEHLQLMLNHPATCGEDFKLLSF